MSETMNQSAAGGEASDTADVKGEAKQLFDAYEKSRLAVIAAEGELEARRRELSDRIKAIKTRLNLKKPFLYRGRHLIVSHKGDTYFFKERNDESALVVD